MLSSIIKPAAVLLIVCMVVTAALAFTYSQTKDIIEERRIEKAREARKEVLNDAETFSEINFAEQWKDYSGQVVMIHEGYSGDNHMGYVFSVTAKGYGGDVEITVGIDTSGTIKGVKIGKNSETPGLGSKAQDDEFLSQFEGVNPDKALAVVKIQGSEPEQIDAISGATITSTAVTNGVQSALEAYEKLMQEGEDE